jgi:hypothetical protein
MLYYLLNHSLHSDQPQPTCSNVGSVVSFSLIVVSPGIKECWSHQSYVAPLVPDKKLDRNVAIKIEIALPNSRLKENDWFHPYL